MIYERPITTNRCVWKVQLISNDITRAEKVTFPSAEKTGYDKTKKVIYG